MCGRVSTSETWRPRCHRQFLLRRRVTSESITGVVPHQIACDEHPRYRSSSWARSRSGDRPVRIVGHHHAHVASVMGENGRDGERTSSRNSVRRHRLRGGRRSVGRGTTAGDVQGLSPSRASGIRTAARWRCRSGTAVPNGARPPVACRVGLGIRPRARGSLSAREQSVLLHQMETGFGCVDTSSMGRLFDAVSSLTGVRQRVDYGSARLPSSWEGVSRGVDSAGSRYTFD